MKAEFNWDLVPTYNVIAKMTGSQFPDRWVLRGNHHDAWVIGARDPISGLVTVLEQARAFAELAKTGWRPRRTIVFCAWDGEEPGLLGSTEWAEQHGEMLRKKAVAYVNTDTNARGFLSIGGSHSLETVAAEVADLVADPLTAVSVAERLKSSKLVHGSVTERKDYRSRRSIRIDALGSGSDYSAFLQHLGIASYYISFRGEGVGGEYHTCFDTFDHYSRYIDPTFGYGIALTKICGRITLRLANAEILPFDFKAQAETFNGYIQEITELTDTMREETEIAHRLLKEKRFTLAADPTLPFVPPQPKSSVPHLNFAPLLNAGARLEHAALDFHDALIDYRSSGRTLTNDRLTAVNEAIIQTERDLTNESGLPRRPWYRHQIYAPGFYTGYGVKTIPGVREAIEERNWNETDEQIAEASAALIRLAERLESSLAVINGR